MYCQNKKRIHRFTIKEPYLTYIKKGIKKAEGRVNSEAFSKLQVGDLIEFYNFQDKVLCEIIFLHRYHNFQEMLEKEGIKTMLPYTDSFEEGIKIYEKFPGANRVQLLGALAIGIKNVL